MILAGTDEAGYGALAGPIVAVTIAVELEDEEAWPLEQVNDSKTLSEKKREELREALPAWLIEHDAEVGIAVIGVNFINKEGYSRAHSKALEDSVRKATKAAGVRPDMLIVDGNRNISGYPWPQRNEAKADGKYFVVAAASILAKIIRDDIMVSLDAQIPEYGFARHKGYGTLDHKDALLEHGLSDQHRKQPCATVLGKTRGGRKPPKGW